MGLDQYLKVAKYISGTMFDTEDDQKLYKKITKATNVKPDTNCQYVVVEYNVAYWRKANAIHAWFVKNVQNGQDNCQKTYVSREQLQKLVDDCAAVLSGQKFADDTLPTQSGFFFGSTEYDEYYKRDLQYTVDKLTEILHDDSVVGSFYYQASW